MSFDPAARSVQGGSTLSFTLNGKEVELTNFDARQSLLEYVRDSARLTGTKRSCLQGGCGACLVVVERYDHATGQWLVKPVNSCLKPLASCDGARITTVEGIGSERRGCHSIQERIAGNHAMQCGYCTPGFVMSAYALLRENGKPSAQQAMEAFDGNICRCTGYRNLVNVSESYAKDASPACQELAAKYAAFDADTIKVSPTVPAPPKLQPKTFRTGDFTWHAPTSLAEVMALRKQYPKAQVVLGDTAKGIRGSSYEVCQGKATDVIFIGFVVELLQTEVKDGCLVIGAAKRIQDVISALRDASDKLPYAQQVMDALETPAQRHIRGEGGWAGNLWITRVGFQSDLAPALVAADAKISYLAADGKESTIPVEDMMPGRIGAPSATALLTKLHIPLTCPPNTMYRYYRTAARKWLAHAFVNAGFRLSVDPSSKTITDARVAVGVYSAGLLRSKQAESVLMGGTLSTETLQKAIGALHAELDGSFTGEPQYVTVDNPRGKDEYRKQLPDVFLFKMFQEAQAANGVGGWKPEELGTFGVGPSPPLKKSNITFQELEGREGIPQLQSKSLTTGEVKFADDQQISSLYAYLLFADCATGKLKSVDTTAALKCDGVHAVVTAKDLPEGSSNSSCFVPGQFPLLQKEGEDIVGAAVVVAIVVADTYRQAKKAAGVVKVDIENKGEGVLASIGDAIAANSYLPELLGCPIFEHSVGDVDAALKATDPVKMLEGRTHVIGQHGFAMEKQSSLAVPEDQGSMLLYCATQNPDLVRHNVAENLGLSNRASHVIVRQNRAGGAFGSKLSKSILPACCAAVAADLLERPVRVQLDACQEHFAIGGRHPLDAKFQVAYSPNGKIQACRVESWLQSGCTHDFTGMLTKEYTESLASCYDWGGNFHVKTHSTKTNTLSNTAIRSFGSPQAYFVTETIMEHVADAVGLPVETVREVNLLKGPDASYPWGQKITPIFNADMMWAKLKVDCKYEERLKAVEAFNAEHRWRKRGISLVPLIYEFSYVYTKGTAALVSISGGWLNRSQGGVTVSHGACEIGQGVNTKVAQVAALTLGCPLEKVKVTETSTEIVPNQRFTGGSIMSESACEAVRRACVELNTRLVPYREALKEKNEGKEPSWEELCGFANTWVFGHEANLSATAIFAPQTNCYGKSISPEEEAINGKATDFHGDYASCGAGCSEVELDVLTGERRVLRTDILYDVGKAINPGIDMGQVEGGFAFGIGYFTMEEPLFDTRGLDRTQGVWEYKPPMASEMPIEFSAELLRESDNGKGVMGTKAVAEPPFMLSYSVLGALKKAIAAARKDAGASTTFQLPMPCTIDAIQQACAVDPAQFKC